MLRRIGALGFFAFQLIAVMAVAGGPGQRAEPKELADLPLDKTGLSIRYGYALLADTATYLGPEGKVGKYARNKLACANCHMDVGAKPLGNSWLDAHALYPQFREREGAVQTLVDRVNQCLKGNLAGRKPLSVDSEEMRAILLYYRWLGRGRPVLDKDPDERMPKLAFLDVAADPLKGGKVYENHCVSCHGADGKGRLRPDGKSYEFPPLWGDGSWAVGTSMSRLTILARFIKGNMPFESPTKLTDEEAWNVAAFVVSQKRPPWNGKLPFPSLSSKPYDYPIGPWADEFPESQHKFGPFKPIIQHWVEKVGPSAARASSGI